MMRGTAATAIFAVALLAGCTSASPTPNPSPVTSTEPAPSPSPSPTPTTPVAKPEPPADLARTDEAGAAAAATYFLALYPYVMSTGDVEEWNAMSGGPCTFCSGIRDDALKIVQNGDTYSGGTIELSQLEVLARDELLGGYPIDANFVQAATLHLAQDGSVLTQTSGDIGTIRIDVLNDSTGWKIFAVVVKDRK